MAAVGTLADFICSAEVDSACAKVLLCKTLVTPDSRRTSDKRKKSTTKR